jgi:hypothetical protein
VTGWGNSWSLTPLVAGTTLGLIMAMTGRVAFCDELTGDGVAILRGRCDPA